MPDWMFHGWTGFITVIAIYLLIVGIRDGWFKRKPRNPWPALKPMSDLTTFEPTVVWVSDANVEPPTDAKRGDIWHRRDQSVTPLFFDGEQWITPAGKVWKP